MPTLAGNYVCDSSTLINFIAWAKAISTAFSTFGWAKSSDTGQVIWSTLSAVPVSRAYVYEIWQPNDGLQNFYLKIEYGNPAGSNCPGLRLSIGTATDGAGLLIGNIIGPFITNDRVSPASASAIYPCYFSGAAGRIAVMMWPDEANYCSQLFAVERSINAQGAYTSTHVTLMTAGMPSDWNCNPYSQQTFVFGLGSAPAQSAQTQQHGGGMPVRIFFPGVFSAAQFNGNVPFDTIAPFVGYFDYPLTSLGVATPSTQVEGSIFSSTLYGVSHQYMPTACRPLSGCLPIGGGTSTYDIFICMRYD